MHHGHVEVGPFLVIAMHASKVFDIGRRLPQHDLGRRIGAGDTNLSYPSGRSAHFPSELSYVGSDPLRHHSARRDRFHCRARRFGKPADASLLDAGEP
jgi:hypothetical protein